jgi:chromosome segregation ATPase
MVSREEDLKKHEKSLQSTEQVMNQQANRLEQLEQDLASKLETLYQRELQATAYDSDMQKMRKKLDQQAAENEAELHRLKKYDTEVLTIKQEFQRQKAALEAKELEFNRAVAEDSALVRGLKEFEESLRHRESHLEFNLFLKVLAILRQEKGN